MSDFEVQVTDTVRAFVKKYLDDSITPLVRNTTPEQRQPLWDALTTYAINVDSSKHDEYAQAIESACISLCFAQMPDALETEVEKLYAGVADEVALVVWASRNYARCVRKTR